MDSQNKTDAFSISNSRKQEGEGEDHDPEGRQVEIEDPEMT